MDRVFIEDINESLINQIVLIKGWIDVYKKDNLVLQDFTGKISVRNLKSISLSNRDVVAIEGYVNKDRDCYYIYSIKIDIINKCTTSVNIGNTLGDFLKQSYQYYHDTNRINNLKKVNLLSEEVRCFLTNNKFIELNNPLLWTSVQEYGKAEIKAVDPFDLNKEYVLPQSPNIQNLISIIGGIERNFQFNHCFRADKEKENREDSIFEFTQLAITAAFMSNEDGKELIEELISNLLFKLNEKVERPFKTISYFDSIKLYNTDKPDLRYEKFFTPLITIEKNKSFKSLIIPFKLADDMIFSLSKSINKKIGDNFYILYISNNNVLNMFGSFKLKYNWKEINDLCKIDNFTIIIVEQNAENVEILFSSICKILYPKFYGVVPKFKFCWIQNYPYIDITKGKESNHDNIGQNIFTKINDEVEKDIEYNYEKLNSKGIDLVLNGIELASGSEKEYLVDNFIRNLKLLDIKGFEEKYNYFIDALKQGAPPFFSIGIGWERLLWLLLQTQYIQEVMIFPKNYNGICLLTGTPLK